MQLPGLWEERGAVLEGLLNLSICLKKITDSEVQGNGPVGLFWEMLESHDRNDCGCMTAL